MKDVNQYFLHTSNLLSFTFAKNASSITRGSVEVIHQITHKIWLSGLCITDSWTSE